jgi:hypothetical protein
MPPPRVFLVDNYDSFTYNLAQELGELGADVTVERHDAFTLEELAAHAPDGIVISLQRLQCFTAWEFRAPQTPGGFGFCQANNGSTSTIHTTRSAGA